MKNEDEKLIGEGYDCLKRAANEMGRDDHQLPSIRPKIDQPSSSSVSSPSTTMSFDPFKSHKISTSDQPEMRLPSTTDMRLKQLKRRQEEIENEMMVGDGEEIDHKMVVYFPMRSIRDERRRNDQSTNNNHDQILMVDDDDKESSGWLIDFIFYHPSSHRN